MSASSVLLIGFTVVLLSSLCPLRPARLSNPFRAFFP